MYTPMRRQAGWVQQEQSDMCLALIIAKVAKGGFSHAVIEETHYLIKKPHPNLGEVKMRGVEFPGDRYVKPVIDRHRAMVRENKMDYCLSCRNSTTQNRQTCTWFNWMCAPPPDPLSQPKPELGPHPPRTTSVPPADNDGAYTSQLKGVLSRYVQMHTPLPHNHIFNIDVNTTDCNNDKDCIPDLLTDTGLSTS